MVYIKDLLLGKQKTEIQKLRPIKQITNSFSLKVLSKPVKNFKIGTVNSTDEKSLNQTRRNFGVYADFLRSKKESTDIKLLNSQDVIKNQGYKKHLKILRSPFNSSRNDSFKKENSIIGSTNEVYPMGINSKLEAFENKIISTRQKYMNDIADFDDKLLIVKKKVPTGNILKKQGNDSFILNQRLKKKPTRAVNDKHIGLILGHLMNRVNQESSKLNNNKI